MDTLGMGARGIFFQGWANLGFWRRKSPSGVQAWSPGGDLASPQKPTKIVKIMHK